MIIWIKYIMATRGHLWPVEFKIIIARWWRRFDKRITKKFYLYQQYLQNWRKPVFSKIKSPSLLILLSINKSILSITKLFLFDPFENFWPWMTSGDIENDFLGQLTSREKGQKICFVIFQYLEIVTFFRNKI